MISGDLSSGKGVDDLAKQALDKAGGYIGVLVNNAGTMPSNQDPIKGTYSHLTVWFAARCCS